MGKRVLGSRSSSKSACAHDSMGVMRLSVLACRPAASFVSRAHRHTHDHSQRCLLAYLPPCLRPAAQTPRAEVLALVAPHHLPAPACGIWGGFYEMHVACGMHKRNATPGVYWRILLSRSIASGVAFDLKTRAHGCALICSRTHTPPRMSAHVVPKAMSAPAPL